MNLLFVHEISDSIILDIYQQGVYVLPILAALIIAPLFYLFITILLDPLSTVSFIFFSIVGPILVELFLIFAAIQFLNNEDSIYLKPQPVEYLVIIKEGGVPIFSYDFTNRLSTDDILFSSGITAVTTLMEEAIGVTTDVHSISFGDWILMTEFYELFAVILIVSEETAVIRNSLSNFANEFFKHELGSGNKIVSDDTQLQQLVKSKFGFV